MYNLGMSSIVLIVLIVVIAILIGVVIYALSRRKKLPEDGQGLGLILQQINELSRMVDTKLGEQSKHIHESFKYQFSESSKMIKDITEELTNLKETNKQVISFADQLQNLQDILKNPKQRGILGEYYLETILKNVLPASNYQMQYPFPDGTIVDAVVFVKDKIIPIDSKFSLENYNRLVEERDANRRDELERAFKQDLKNRIDETSKYIQPSEGTMDFAFMFIPHEAIYYDLLVAEVGGIKINTQDLIEYAFKKKVLIVSPTSFLAYLQTVLQGLKALQIEESAKEIRKHVENLGKHLGAYEEYHNKLGSALTTVVNHFNNTSKEFKKIDKDVLHITSEAINAEGPEHSRRIEPVLLDKPSVEE